MQRQSNVTAQSDVLKATVEETWLCLQPLSWQQQKAAGRALKASKPESGGLA